jgi:tellurite resistance protein TerC
VLIFDEFLVFTGVRVATHSGEEIHPERNPVLKLVRNHIEMTDDYHGASFFIRRGGALVATPMFAVLILIEATDVLFAVDSIPAILAVSRSPFIAYSSNAFAILGLRALYFVLAGFKDRLVHLNKGLGVILVYVGVKMLLSY